MFNLDGGEERQGEKERMEEYGKEGGKEQHVGYRGAENREEREVLQEKKDLRHGFKTAWQGQKYSAISVSVWSGP